MATYDNIKKIKIGDNIFNLYDSGNSGGTITSVKTTAGAHTAINVSSGVASFNVPTKTSHLTNDSGFLTSYTDEKVKTDLISSTSETYYLTLSSSNASQTSTLLKASELSVYYGSNMTKLIIGESNADGMIRLYDGGNHYVDLGINGSLSTNRVIYLPDKTGILALTSDIPTVPTITLNGSSTTSPSFYAPTSAGTSGQYLKSNGSSAPTWTTFPTIPTITLNGSATTSPSFYAPTSAGTSGYVLKSNGSGAPSWESAILTDKKLEVAEVTSGTTYYPIVGTETTAATRQYDTTGFIYKGTNGTTSEVGLAQLTLGNSTASGTANNKRGQLKLYGTNDNYVLLEYEGTSYNRLITFPDKAGTVALTSDIPSIPTITDTYSSTSSNGMSGKAVASALSGYLPLSGGTLTGNLTVNGHSSEIGTLLTGQETISVPSTTGALIKRGDGFTLDAGSWVITMSVTFPANSTGYRRVAIGASDNAYMATRNSAPATGGYETPVLAVANVVPINRTTYYAYIHQNSGEQMSNVTLNWRATRIA